jgi:ABC-type nickel/cobalt efflux system permease component RcnA
MVDRVMVAVAFTVLAIALSAAGLLILLARGWSKNWRNWKRIPKRDVVTTAYITTLIAVLLIGYVTTYFLING